MKDSEKSIVLIKNGYCCGHGAVVQRLENVLLSRKIEYKKVDVKEPSTVSYGDKTYELGPFANIQEILSGFGLDKTVSIDVASVFKKPVSASVNS